MDIGVKRSGNALKPLAGSRVQISPPDTIGILGIHIHRYDFLLYRRQYRLVMLLETIQITGYGVLDVLYGLFSSLAIRNASGQLR